MADEPRNSRELGLLFAIAQVGVEMVIPVAVGMYLDRTFGWQPWGVAVGAVLGLAGGLAHLTLLTNRRENRNSSDPHRDPP